MSTHRDDPLMTLVSAIESARGEARARLLHELQEKLETHFRSEDAPDGWFAKATREVPDLKERLDALAAEHLELSAEAVSLLHRPDPDREASFLKALSRHESQEAEVLSELLRKRS